MQFSSSLFLFSFLPTVLVLYYLIPKKGKNALLLISSILFYTWGEPRAIILMLASTIIDFSCGLLIEKGKRKTGLLISLVTNLSFLAFFKYFNFAFENFQVLVEFIGINDASSMSVPQIALPIGISFYTFQTMSYTIDVYFGRVKANPNFINFATYVTMFPQLIAGPIVRYIDVSKQLINRSTSPNNFLTGTERFVIGLAKKVLIANTFGEISDAIFFEDSSIIGTPIAWLGIMSYAFQIYFDFSGYSDMAIGLGKMFGFDFLENFNYPYISTSITGFWRRWHISLSSWFRDYLYIPLGGNRGSSSRTYINLFIVFFITGLWHGSSWNFILWGLFHGTFILIERIWIADRLASIWKPFQHIYCLLVVLVGWVFFRAETLPQAITYLSQMFIPSSGDVSLVSYLSFFHVNMKTLLLMVIAIFLSTPIYSKVRLSFKKMDIEWIYYLGILVLFFLSILYLGAGSYNPFIYFRF